MKVIIIKDGVSHFMLTSFWQCKSCLMYTLSLWNLQNRLKGQYLLRFSLAKCAEIYFCSSVFISVIFPKTYPLFLTGDKGLKPRRHSKAQLVYERRLVLGVDLNFDPRFKRCLVCRQEEVRTFTTGIIIYMNTLACIIYPAAVVNNQIEKKLCSSGMV